METWGQPSPTYRKKANHRQAIRPSSLLPFSTPATSLATLRMSGYAPIPVCSDTLDRHRPLTIQSLRIPLMTLLLAVLQSLAFMILQQPMLPAIMPAAEPAVSDDPLRRVFAFLETAPDFLGRHSTAQGERHVEGRVGQDVV